MHGSIKAKKAEGFHQPLLFRKVMRILESHHFHLGVCRFVLELFDRSVLRQIVYEDESEMEESEQSGNEDEDDNDNDDEEDDDDDEDGAADDGD